MYPAAWLGDGVSTVCNCTWCWRCPLTHAMTFIASQPGGVTYPLTDNFKLWQMHAVNSIDVHFYRLFDLRMP